MSMSIHLDNPPNKKPKKYLTPKNRLFIKNIAQGKTKKESAILAGYSRNTANVIGNKLFKNELIQKELEKIGLTDNFLASSIKKNIVEGTGVKATADTATKNIELALKLKGYLQNDSKQGDTNNTQNIYINELNNLSDNDLQARLNALQEVTGTIK